MQRRIAGPLSGFTWLVVSALAGCSGEPRTDVTGKVLYNSTPLNKPGGQIIFVGPKGSQVAVAINADGTYRAERVEFGANRIAVTYPHPGASTKTGRPFPGKANEPTPRVASPFLTPAKYANVDTSELSVQVEKDKVFDVNLKGPPIP